MKTGAKLKTLRQDKGVTAIFVAVRMCISKGYLCDLENDRRNWSPKLEKAYKDALGIK